MQRYLIMCRNDLQWESYVQAHRSCKEILSITIEEKENSFILRNLLDGSEAVYVKQTPACEAPNFYVKMAEKIWLCDESWYRSAK
jgi:hypothetical protein